MQQQTLKFFSRAHIEFCFDVIHGWCSIHTSLRIWHPDMQPVGALWVCALALCHGWAQLMFCWFHDWPYADIIEGSCFGRAWSLIMQIWFWKVITCSAYCQIKAKVGQTGFRWWTTGRDLIQKRHHSQYNPPVGKNRKKKKILKNI